MPNKVRQWAWGTDTSWTQKLTLLYLAHHLPPNGGKLSSFVISAATELNVKTTNKCLKALASAGHIKRDGDFITLCVDVDGGE